MFFCKADIKNQKLAAFTITEIIVVLAISTIVAGLAFSVINVVQRNKLNIEKNYARSEQIKQLNVALQMDFNTHTQITWKPTEEVLEFTSPIASNNYYFTKDSIYNNVQTFKVSATDKKIFFKGEAIKEGFVDAVKLTFGQQTCFVYKTNDPTIYF